MFVSGLLDKGPFFRNGPGRRRLRISSIRDLSGAMGFNLMVDRALCRAFAGLTLLRWGGAWRCVPRLAAGWSAWVNRARSSVWLERTPDKRKVASSSLARPTIVLVPSSAGREPPARLAHGLTAGAQSRLPRLSPRRVPWAQLRGRSSVGRATALQAVGRRFDPVRLHQTSRPSPRTTRFGAQRAISVLPRCVRRARRSLTWEIRSGASA